MTAWRNARLRARACRTPSKSAAETRRILKRLGTQHPNADTELHFTNAYELLVATILSAQCTDERVNQVTPALFARYPDARALARATTDELEPQIQSTGFLPRQVALAPGHGDRSRRDARRRDAAHDGRRWSHCRASAARRPTSCSGTRSACRAFPSIATSFASPTGSASPGPTIPKSSSSSSARPCRRGLDAHLRHADPARPPHLQAAPALRSLRRPRRLRVSMRS